MGRNSVKDASIILNEIHLTRLIQLSDNFYGKAIVGLNGHSMASVKSST